MMNKKSGKLSADRETAQYVNVGLKMDKGSITVQYPLSDFDNANYVCVIPFDEISEAQYDETTKGVLINGLCYMTVKDRYETTESCIIPMDKRMGKTIMNELGKMCTSPELKAV